MSTVTSSTPAPSFNEIKGYLNQIGRHLFEQTAVLLPEQPASAEQLYLQRLNDTLRTHNEALRQKIRALYQPLEQADLQHTDGQALLARLASGLNPQVQTLHEQSVIDGKGLRRYFSHEAGINALEHEARRDVSDRLLHPEMARQVENISLGPPLRPGLYALTFSYQELRIEFAGAFVLTTRNSPIVTTLTGTEAVGNVLLFTPTRGLEAFDSLIELDRYLLQAMEVDAWGEEFTTLLPRRYQSLGRAGIWPLELLPIATEPLFEHTCDAVLDKRRQDIDWALNLHDNPGRSARQIVADLDLAIQASFVDLSPRLALHAQRLLDRCMRYSAPDWYRSASDDKRAALAQLLARYNQARQALLRLVGPAATAPDLARYQLIEYLAAELEIHDLNPDLLHVRTRRDVAGVGSYQQQRSLTVLALRGLHSGDELPGSDFLNLTTITYDQAPLNPEFQALSPASLLTLLGRVQPRLAFAAVQKESHANPLVKTAIMEFYDHRLEALAYTSMLQGHLRETDYRLIQALRAGNAARLSAAAVSLHEAQLKDFWVLRQADSAGTFTRLLLCTPETPTSVQFHAFDSEVACQAHILGCCLEPGMKEYLLGQVVLRFRPSMEKLLAGLGFKPHAQEYREISFVAAASHAACLQQMAGHLLSMQLDDHTFSTPLWYSSASNAERQALTRLAEDAKGALGAYDADPRSLASFPRFETYLHDQAKIRLNALLGRTQRDVDPDTVWVHYPRAFPGLTTPASTTYTRLYRDGYESGVGFLDPKFEASATFTGPAGIDLSAMTPELIARSVRGIWIGERYANAVRNQLQSSTSPGYAFRREATLAINQLQMRNAAHESRLKGHIVQADLDWLETCLLNLGNTSAQVRESYQVHRLFVDGEWVIDNLLFRRGNDPVLLYTPNAVDGVAFREARLFNYVLKNVDGMVGYFSSRVGTQAQKRVRAFLEKAKDQLPANLDRTHPSPGRYDPISRETVVLDMRLALYDAKLQRKIDDVHATTPNRAEMIMGLFWDVIEPLVALATAPYPVMSLSLGMLLAFKDGMLALHAYNQGDTAGALRHYLGYLLNTAGTLFTDLRPAIKSIAISLKTSRQLLRSVPQKKALALIKQLDTAHPSVDSLQAVLYEGRALWAPRVPNANGHYLLYRQDPTTGQFLSTARLVNQNTEGRWVRARIPGGAPEYEKLLEASPLKDYEIPQTLWRDFEVVLDPRFRAVSVNRNKDFVGLANAEATLRYNLFPLRAPYETSAAKLIQDAEAFFKSLPPQAPRADVLAVDVGASHSDILTNILTEKPALIVGASVDSIAAKQLLTVNLPTFYDKGVRRLYIEYLPADVFRSKLAKLNRGQRSRHIERHLAVIDEVLGIPADADFSYRKLVLKAREVGMEVRGLDASTSYDLDDALDGGLTPSTTTRPNLVRNFYSHKVLQADIAAKPDEGWIALVDHRRLVTYEQVPGLADLQKTVALRVEDVAAGQPVGIWKDSPGSIPGDLSAKADYKLTLRTAYKKTQVPSLEATASQRHGLFEMHPSLHDNMRTLMSMKRGLDSDYSLGVAELRPAFIAFLETRDRLKAAAETFFKQYVPPAKPLLPSLTPGLSEVGFFENAFKHVRGLIFGEAHSGQSVKALLIRHMKALREMQVKTLYVEHLLTELHQADLDAFFRGAALSPNLKAYLQAQDRGHMGFYSGLHNYSTLIETAGKYGIRVRALDCLASYHLKGMRSANEARISMFNFFASEVISQDQAAFGPHNWVALMGRTHTDPFLGVPGLARMQGAISLHVHDVAPEVASGLRLGGWEAVNEPMRYEFKALRSDFVLEVGVPGKTVPAAFVPADQSRLRLAGHFLIERPTLAETRLVHRSRSGEILTTPIQVDDAGLFFVDHWEVFSHRRFTYQNQLIDELISTLNLSPAPL